MKKTLQVLALLLALTMLLAACGTAATTTPAETSGGSDGTTTEAGPPTQLKVVFLTVGSQPADLGLVEQEINNLLVPKINVEIELEPINFGAAMEQYNVMLASGEKVDLLMTFPTTYTTLVSQGKLQSIGTYIDEYGMGIKEVLGDFLKGSYVNGEIYGVRPVSDMAGAGALCIRKDIVEKYDLPVDNMTSFEDIGAVLEIIKANEPEFYPLGYSNQDQGVVESIMQFSTDTLGDSFGVLLNYGQELTVENMFTSDEYVNALEVVRDWYVKGYIMPDIATSKEDQHSLVSAGRIYGYIAPSKPGIEIQESAQNGFECVVPQFSPAFSSTFNVTLFQWVVPQACETPDKAVQLLNEMYTNPELENLLSWGIEGQHYEMKEDGTIGFPEGVSSDNSGYFMNTPWMMGNEFIAHVWSGNPADLWDQTKAFNESARLSKAMGFTYDPSAVKTEVAAVSSVYSQYKLSLESGSVDIDEVYPTFISKLESAGIDKIIAEKQSQLDAWAQMGDVG